MLSKIIPGRVKSWLRWNVKNIVEEMDIPVPALKYIPYKQDADSYVLLKSGKNAIGNTAPDLALPPDVFIEGLGNSAEEYLSEGKTHITTMLNAAETSGFYFKQGDRILDMGCGTGRMMRHLHHLTSLCEIWGTDINGPQVTWAKQHLRPAFHFATTTTIPHLPFEDRYFNFIYCGSVFTHIEDLTEAWLCELKRVLLPGGRLYITIHDNHSIWLLETKYKEHWFAKNLMQDNFFNASKGNYDMLVLGRDTISNVFYDIDYFTRLLELTGFKTHSVIQEAYAYQTAVLVERT